MDSEIFEKLPPTKLFFRLAIPSMITMAFGALYQIADGLFVGQHYRYEAVLALLPYGLGGYVLLVLFHRA